MVNIKQLQNFYFPFDKEVEYKGLVIYPIKVIDYPTYEICKGVLDLPKQDFHNDMKIKLMTYYEYLLSLMAKEEGIILDLQLRTILGMCLHLEENKIYYPISFKDGSVGIHINGVDLNSQEFNDLRKIILFQNDANYDDTYINKDIRNSMLKYYKSINKNMEEVTLEKKIASVTSHTGINKSDLLNMTYRSFDLLFGQVNAEVDYIAYKIAELSGQVTFKQPISHWIFSNKKDTIGEAFVSFDAIKNKISNGN